MEGYWWTRENSHFWISTTEIHIIVLWNYRSVQRSVVFPALSDPSTHERAVRSIEALPCPDLSVWVSVGTNHNSMADESGNQGRAGSSGEGSPQELQDSVTSDCAAQWKAFEVKCKELQGNWGWKSVPQPPDPEQFSKEAHPDRTVLLSSDYETSTYAYRVDHCSLGQNPQQDISRLLPISF